MVPRVRGERARQTEAQPPAPGRRAGRADPLCDGEGRLPARAGARPRGGHARGHRGHARRDRQRDWRALAPGRDLGAMPYLDLDAGFRLYFERHGPELGSGAPVVLFAHGAGGNAMSWWQQVPAFADRYTAITFDHRAFGRSRDVEDGPGRMAFGTDAVALLDYLEIERVHIVAHSMGGRTAMALLRLVRERLASLTLSGTNAGSTDDRLRARKAELEASGALAGSLLSRALAPDFHLREPA